MKSLLIAPIVVAAGLLTAAPATASPLDTQCPPNGQCIQQFFIGLQQEPGNLVQGALAAPGGFIHNLEAAPGGFIQNAVNAPAGFLHNLETAPSGFLNNLNDALHPHL